MRMLDNVIDINFYPTPKLDRANLRHRPMGLGVMGFQDALYIMRFAYASDAAVAFADRSMEMFPTLRFRLEPNSLVSVARTRRMQVRSGTGVCCPSTPSTCWSRNEAVDSSGSDCSSIGPPCGKLSAARHAEQQRDGDRADRDHLDYHRRHRNRSNRIQIALREVQSVG